MADNYTKVFSSTDGTPITTSSINTEFDAIATGLAALEGIDESTIRANEALTQIDDSSAAGKLLSFDSSGDVDYTTNGFFGLGCDEISVAVGAMTGFASTSTGSDLPLSSLAANSGGTTHTTGWTQAASGLTPPSTDGIYLAMLRMSFFASVVIGAGTPALEIRIISRSGTTQVREFSRMRSGRWDLFSANPGRISMACPVWCDSGEEIAVRAYAEGSGGVYQITNVTGALTLSRIASRSLLG